jgi:hypothetical protein
MNIKFVKIDESLTVWWDKDDTVSGHYVGGDSGVYVADSHPRDRSNRNISYVFICFKTSLISFSTAQFFAPSKPFFANSLLGSSKYFSTFSFGKRTLCGW